MWASNIEEGVEVGRSTTKPLGTCIRVSFSHAMKYVNASCGGAWLPLVSTWTASISYFNFTMSRLVVLAILSWPLLSVVAQGNTTCKGTTLDWYTSVVGETPCTSEVNF